MWCVQEVGYHMYNRYEWFHQPRVQDMWWLFLNKAISKSWLIKSNYSQLLTGVSLARAFKIPGAYIILGRIWFFLGRRPGSWSVGMATYPPWLHSPSLLCTEPLCAQPSQTWVAVQSSNKSWALLLCHELERMIGWADWYLLSVCLSADFLTTNMLLKVPRIQYGRPVLTCMYSNIQGLISGMLSPGTWRNPQFSPCFSWGTS